MLDFTDHVVFVTGAGAGIGFGIAEAFHRAGARVALGDLREPALDRAADGLGRSAHVFSRVVDVRDARSVDGFLSAAEDALGPVTVAVANAGVYPTQAHPPARPVRLGDLLSEGIPLAAPPATTLP